MDSMRIVLSRRMMLVAPFLALTVGCGPKDEIRTYEVPKPKAASDDATAPTGPDKSRLLGAIIPTGDGRQFWFVKFSGPIDVISRHEKDFDQFVNSVRVEGNSPKWTAPAGWTENPAKMMRLVTFLPPDAGKDAPELYVSEPFAGSVIENVNRWRKEVGAKEVTEAELPQATSELTLGSVKAYRVDARGPKEVVKGSMPPFMRK
jgi:hypothetical protein